MRRIVLGGLAVLLLVACGPTQPTGAASSSRVASGVRAEPASPAPLSRAGGISGSLGYPSEFLPGEAVYAIALDGKSYYKVESASYQSHYTMQGVEPGYYFVYAVSRWPVASPPVRFGAGYTKAVPCGLQAGCDDHSPIPVRVKARTIVTGIAPTDWYAEPNRFPVVPDRMAPTSSPAPTDYRGAEVAATSLVGSRLLTRQVPAQSDCPVNVACSWYVGIEGGHNSAYFSMFAGSNGDVVRCMVYVVDDVPRWRPLDIRCGVTVGFPALHQLGRVQLGMGETGCVRVRSAPGVTARVLACLKEGTPVLIDGGPYYLPTNASAGPSGPSAVDLWWHVTQGGWMVHKYLYGD
jgi:hypothetical protein